MTLPYLIRRLGLVGLLAVAMLTLAVPVTPDMARLGPDIAGAQAPPQQSAHVDPVQDGVSALVTPGNSKPFPGNPHWQRNPGSEVVVQYRVDGNAKALHPLLADAVYQWNNRSPGSPYMHLQLLPLGADCVSYHCVTVAENNTIGCGEGYTLLQWSGNVPGHLHMLPALLTVNLQDCPGQTLLWAKFLMCHEVGHTQAVDHDPTAVRPCSPGDGLPVVNDINVRNILTAGTG